MVDIITTKRYGCCYLDYLFTDFHHFFLCCMANIGLAEGEYYQDLAFPISDDYGYEIDKFINFLQNFKVKLETNYETTTCYQIGCGVSKFLCYPEQNYIRQVSFITSPNNHSFCNFKCVYCKAIGKPTTGNYQEFPKMFKLICALESKNLIIPQKTGITLNYGEWSIMPQREEMIDLSDKYPMYIISNASTYSGKLLEKISKGHINLNVSLDAGTAPTFKKIKGVNLFDVVTENLIKYATSQQKYLDLKYVLLQGFNDNKQEISAFIDFARKIKNSINTLIISPEQYMTSYPGSYKNMVYFFIDKAFRAEIPVKLKSLSTEKLFEAEVADYIKNRRKNNA